MGPPKGNPQRAFRLAVQDGTEETRLLRELLAEAHSRVRELQLQLDRLSEELLAVRLSDRRRASESHAARGRERRLSSKRKATPSALTVVPPHQQSDPVYQAPWNRRGDQDEDLS